jgi:hypothetical protein
MKPDDIPQDVWAAARAAQDEAVAFCLDNKLAVSEYPFASGRAKEALDRSIARAIYAERERCAQLAEQDVRTATAIQQSYRPTWYVRALEIAAAIRKGSANAV